MSSLIDKIESSHRDTLTVNGKKYYVHHMECINFDILMSLTQRYYIVRGWLIGRDVWGYTIVLNTHLKGIYNHFPT